MILNQGQVQEIDLMSAFTSESLMRPSSEIRTAVKALRQHRQDVHGTSDVGMYSHPKCHHSLTETTVQGSRSLYFLCIE